MHYICDWQWSAASCLPWQHDDASDILAGHIRMSRDTACQQIKSYRVGGKSVGRWRTWPEEFPGQYWAPAIWRSPSSRGYVRAHEWRQSAQWTTSDGDKEDQMNAEKDNVCLWNDVPSTKCHITVLIPVSFAHIKGHTKIEATLGTMALQLHAGCE